MRKVFLTILLTVAASATLAFESYVPFPSYVQGEKAPLAEWLEKNKGRVTAAIIDTLKHDEQRAFVALGHNSNLAAPALDVYVYGCDLRSCTLMMSRHKIPIHEATERPVRLAFSKTRAAVEVRSDQGALLLSGAIPRVSK